MIIRGRTLAQIMEEGADPPDNCNVNVSSKSYISSTPAAEIVLLGQKARQLQDSLARANSSKADLVQAEYHCIQMHKAICSILAWIAIEEKKHEA